GRVGAEVGDADRVDDLLDALRVRAHERDRRERRLARGRGGDAVGQVLREGAAGDGGDQRDVGALEDDADRRVAARVNAVDDAVVDVARERLGDAERR